MRHGHGLLMCVVVQLERSEPNMLGLQLQKTDQSGLGSNQPGSRALNYAYEPEAMQVRQKMADSPLLQVSPRFSHNLLRSKERWCPMT